MCDDHGHVHVPAVEAVPRDADWPGEVLPLEPVDSVSVLTVCDNTIDILLRDEGPAKRPPLRGALTGETIPLLEAAALEEGKSPDAPFPSTGSRPWSRSARATPSAGSSSTPGSHRTDASRTFADSGATLATSR